MEFGLRRPPRIGGGVQRRAGHDFIDLPRRVEANLQVRFGLGAFLNASYMEFVCFRVCAERPAARITVKTTDNEVNSIVERANRFTGEVSLREI
jgi:hypothetical protein